MSFRAELPKKEADLKFMSLRAEVTGKGKSSHQWKEVTDLISISPTGSSFNLRRKCEVGTLIALALRMPVHMRYFDFDKESYRVWGLIQYCERMTGDDSSTFHVGVAFIGKTCPESYKTNPKQHYRISGVGEDGMWTVAELKTPFRKRADVRFWRPVDLYLALIDTKSGSAGGERTVAENVSRSGAAVFTTLDISVGDRVKFISEKYDFSGLAVVCDVQTADDGKTRIHIKFVENTFPVGTLMSSDVVLLQS